MTYLITKHDYKHLHAISGLIAILNFIYNIYNLIFFNSNKLNIYLVANNLFLALLSLQFKLPEKRNLDKPMIWKEFRLHSILFTFRHTSITILSLLKLDYYIVKHFIIIITLYLADLITQKYGNYEIRTTNYMPYYIICICSLFSCIGSKTQIFKIIYRKHVTFYGFAFFYSFSRI